MNPDAGTHPGPEHITAHPLIRSYLRDLDQMLAGAEDRTEVLDAVTEHITQAAAAFPSPPTTEQVQGVLTGLGPVERIAAAQTDPPPERTAGGAWLGTPTGIVALVALVLSVCLPPLFFPLAGLAFVLAVIALVRRRPRPRSALVITIISGVLLLAVLAIGILATLALFSLGEPQEAGEPGAPRPAVTSVPATAPAQP